ncbi:hypothetical protein BDV34DRAFT_92247 [Aspergillus parasiticus]|uniref:Uncharacterized protein n=1 Tax=Aspergillus parasiticus TaxID=5067 RepID=A0A5N6DM42_ASPPA|nr:hypothetical protein BDV34DRAFT_92247 [Aspergillus parasiticus]
MSIHHDQHAGKKSRLRNHQVYTISSEQIRPICSCHKRVSNPCSSHFAQLLFFFHRSEQSQIDSHTPCSFWFFFFLLLSFLHLFSHCPNNHGCNVIDAIAESKGWEQN